MPKRLRTLAVALIAVLISAIISITAQKNLVGTLTGNDWGRHLFGLSAALTEVRWGIGGYVTDGALEGTLGLNGIATDPGLLGSLGTKYPDNFHDPALMQRALDSALNLKIAPPAGYERLRGSHGDDVGVASFTLLAFAFFGITVASLYYTFFALLSASLVVFVVAYWRSTIALACAALMLLALYALCASDVVNLVQRVAPFDGGPGTSITDPRFFGALAAIPALHILLIWILPVQRPSIADYIALAAQTALLAFTIHVRWPVLWMVPALLAYGVLSAMIRRAPRDLIPAAVVAVVAGAGIIAPTLLAHPLYRIDGDLLHHPIWHNMMTTLQQHPTWLEKYASTVDQAWGDPMPGIVARQEIAKLPAEQRAHYLYSTIDHPNPEAVNFFARKRFFEIARQDPRMVLETFLILAPKRLWFVTSTYHASHAAVLSAPVLAVIVIALGLTIWIAASDPGATTVLLRTAACGAAFAAIAAAPTIIGGPHPLLLTDHFLWFFFFGGAACTALVLGLAEFVLKRRIVPAASKPGGRTLLRALLAISLVTFAFFGGIALLLGCTYDPISCYLIFRY